MKRELFYLVRERVHPNMMGVSSPGQVDIRNFYQIKTVKRFDNYRNTSQIYISFIFYILAASMHIRVKTRTTSA